MKQLGMMLMFIMSSGWGMAQGQLVQARFYFDGDISSAQYFTLENVQALDAAFTLDVAGLSQGMHKVYFEVLNESMVYSHYDVITFQLIGGQQMFALNNGEYFFDQDPGFGNGIQFDAAGNAWQSNLEIQTNGLSQGLHRLFVRVKDGSGAWSHTDMVVVQVIGGQEMKWLNAMEYFFDEDPGYGQAYPIEITSTFTWSATLSLDIPATLSNGNHILYLRCRDQSMQWSHYATVGFTVCDIQWPEITMQGSNCPGDTIQLNAGDGYLAYDWGSKNNDSIFNATQDGSYVVWVSDEDCMASDTVEVFFELPDAPMILQNENLLYTNEIGDDYQWYLDGALLAGATSASLNILETGNYTLMLNQGTNCEVMSDVFFATYVGLHESVIDDFWVFPNPASDFFVIQTGGSMVERIEVRDMTNRLCWSSIRPSSAVSVDTHGWASGVYIINLYTENKKGSQLLHVVH